MGKEKKAFEPVRRSITIRPSPLPESEYPGSAAPEERPKKLKAIEESEQYALVAGQDDWYACLHKDRPFFYLHGGEVWKYGVSNEGVLGRFALAFLVAHSVSYIIQHRGSHRECVAQQQARLMQYPNMPENVARPAAERLPVPPYNARKV